MLFCLFNTFYSVLYVFFVCLVCTLFPHHILFVFLNIFDLVNKYTIQYNAMRPDNAFLHARSVSVHKGLRGK